MTPPIYFQFSRYTSQGWERQPHGVGAAAIGFGENKNRDTILLLVTSKFGVVSRKLSMIPGSKTPPHGSEWAFARLHNLQKIFLL